MKLFGRRKYYYGCFINRLFETIEYDNDRVFIISFDNRSSAIFIVIILLYLTGYYHTSQWLAGI